MIYFVTETWLKNNTPITKNVDATDILPWTKIAGDLVVEPLLGSSFYNDLLTKYNNETLNSDEMVIVEMLKPIIAWQAASDCAFDLAYQLKNKGPQKQNGDNSVELDNVEVSKVVSYYKKNVNGYQEKLFEYLKCNRALYPIFDSNENRFSTIRKGIDTSFNSTMILI